MQKLYSLSKVGYISPTAPVFGGGLFYYRKVVLNYLLDTEFLVGGIYFISNTISSSHESLQEKNTYTQGVFHTKKKKKRKTFYACHIISLVTNYIDSILEYFFYKDNYDYDNLIELPWNINVYVYSYIICDIP